MAIVTTSAPGNAAVAPIGGRAPRYSTSPIAAGIPAPDHPILFDVATSSSSNRAIERNRRAGEPLPFAALVTADGQPTDDPEAFYTDPPGAILPMGGMDTGHKGFALGILVEALTSGLSGWGRAPQNQVGGDDKPFGNNVFMQLINPAAFAGFDAFTTETGHFAASCRDTPAMEPDAPVRMPGDRADALYQEQTTNGVELHPEILPRMDELLQKYAIEPPKAL